MRASRLLLCLVLASAAVLAGCASDRNPDEMEVAREMVAGDEEKRAVDRADAKTLYNTARGFLESGDPQRALELYDKLQARFPFSEYATQAELESIYANYGAYQYEAALAAADRFIKQHPRHSDIDYVYYIRGLANYDRTGGDDNLFSAGRDKRDPTHLRQAFTDFNLLIRNYPNSAYNKDAQLRMIEIKHRLARYELQVAEYYLRRRAWVAASRRAEYIVDHFQGADSVPRALEILEHAYRMLGLEDLAQDSRTILQASYPNYLVHRREFYRQRAGLEPRYELPPMDAEPSDQSSQQAERADSEKVSRR